MDVLNTILAEITGVIEKVEPLELDAVTQRIQKQHRVFVAGEGRSGLMAKGFAMRLMHLGYTVYVVGETITPALAAGDVFIAVSGSGESMNVLGDAKKAKAAGCTVVAVTSKPQSTVAALADTMLTVPGTVKSETGDKRGSVQLLSSLFDQCLHITLDALCLMISRRDATSNEAATAGHW